MSKRALTIQFNWIFILIAGVIILSFFVVLVQRQKEGSDKKIDVTVKTKLDAILTSALQSSGSVFKIGIPSSQLSFDCEGLRVGSTQPAEIGIVFAPERIRSVSRTIYVMALDWSFPYKTTNFLYITSPEIRYVFIKDAEGYADELYYNREKQSMPQNITKAFIERNQIGNYKAKGDYKVRFVFFDVQPENYVLDSSIRRMENRDVTAVLIKPEGGGLDGWGVVTFYQKKQDAFEEEGKSYFLSRASAIGAIFSDNIETYNCTMDAALKRLNTVNRIYHARTSRLRDAVDACDTIYAQGLDNGIKKIADGSSAGLTKSGIEKIYEGAYGNGGLKPTNRILQLRSCPLIY